MLRKNVASQGVYLAAYDTTASPVAGKTGDASNITGAWSKDGGAETSGFTTSHPTSIGGGVYWQPLSQAETNGDRLSYRWSSSTSGVVIDPIFEATELAVPLVQLADGVAHGGTTATCTLKKMLLSNPDATGTPLAVENTNGSNTDHVLLVSNNDGYGLAVSGLGAGVSIFGGTATPGLVIYGPYGTPGPAVMIDTTAGGAGVDGGPGVLIRTAGAGNAAVLFQSDGLADCIQVSDGTPQGLLNSLGRVLTAAPRVAKNTALAGFTFPMYDSVNINDLKSGITPTVTVSIDGASFVSATNSPAEIGTSGVYKLDLAAGDLDGDTITLRATATGALTTLIEIVTQV